MTVDFKCSCGQPILNKNDLFRHMNMAGHEDVTFEPKHDLRENMLNVCVSTDTIDFEDINDVRCGK